MPRGTSRYDEARLQKRLFDVTLLANKPNTYVNFNSRRDRVTVSSGGVSYIKNIGSGTDFDTTAGSPVLSSMPSGVGICKFTASDWAAQGSVNGLNSGDPQFTLLTLARYTTGTLLRILGDKGSNQLFGWWSTHVNTWYDGTAFRADANAFVDTVGTWHLIAIRSQPSTYAPDMRSNGAAITCTGTVGGCPTRLQLNGYGGTLSETSNCEIFAAAVWFGALSDAELYRAEGAFAWEAKLQDSVLPANHPYKNRPPTIGG